MKKLLLPLASFCALLALAACEGEQGPAGPVGPAGPSNIIGYATVAADGSIDHFGGTKTDSVVVTTSSPGIYTVRFYGKYRGITSTDDVTLVATVANTTNFNTGSPQGLSVSDESLIQFTMWIWSTYSNPNPLQSRSFSALIIQ